MKWHRQSYGHTSEIESTRHQRKLHPNAFIRMTPRQSNDRTLLLIADFGPADQPVDNAEDTWNRAQAMMKRGIVPVESGWGGWLGRYDNRLAHASQELIANQPYRMPHTDLDRPMSR